MRGGRTAFFLCEVVSVLLISWAGIGRAAEERAFLAPETPAAGEKKAPAEEIMLYSKPSAGIYLKGTCHRQAVSYVQAPYAAPRLSPDQKTILFQSKRGGKSASGLWMRREKGQRESATENKRNGLPETRRSSSRAREESWRGAWTTARNEPSRLRTGPTAASQATSRTGASSSSSGKGRRGRSFLQAPTAMRPNNCWKPKCPALPAVLRMGISSRIKTAPTSF